MNTMQFIDGKGGPAQMSTDLNGVHTAGAIALWRHRNKLPRGAWPEIMDAYPDVTLDQLKAIETASQAKAA